MGTSPVRKIPMTQKLTILARKGRNKHGQRLAQARCACGNLFEAIENNIKQGRTKSCGHCVRPAPPIHKPATPEPTAPACAPPLTPEWYAEQIAVKESAAVAAEKRAIDLEEKLAKQNYTDLDTHKQRKTEATTARDLRAEIARLQTAKAKAETATVKEAKSAADITKEKIAALRGSK